MATVQELKREVEIWLAQELGKKVDSEEDFDREELKFRISGTRPLQVILIPKLLWDRRPVEDLIAALEQDQVIAALRSGQHWKGRLTQHGVQWIDE
jgi:hypothetical protein